MTIRRDSCLREQGRVQLDSSQRNAAEVAFAGAGMPERPASAGSEEGAGFFARVDASHGRPFEEEKQVPRGCTTVRASTIPGHRPAGPSRRKGFGRLRSLLLVMRIPVRGGSVEQVD